MILPAILLLISVIGAGVLVNLSYRREVGRARAAVETGGRIVRTADGSIEYAEAGEGVPLLSIHGAGGGYDQGLSIAAELVGHGFRVIAPSRFGYLRTRVPADSSIPAQADAHVALLDALKIDKAVIVGTSAGARSAIELVLRHAGRVSAVVLIVPGTYAPTSPVMVEGSRASKLTLWLVNAGANFAWWTLEKIAPTVLIRFMGVPPKLFSATSKSEQQRVLQIVKSVQPLSLRFRGINLDSAADLQLLPLETIRSPTLVVSARDDLFNTLPAAEFTAASIPNAKLVAFETGGHLLVGHWSEVRDLVRKFLTAAGVTKTEP